MPRTTAFLDEVRCTPSRNYILNAYRQIFPARDTAYIPGYLRFDPGSPGVYQRIFPK